MSSKGRAAIPKAKALPGWISIRHEDFAVLAQDMADRLVSPRTELDKSSRLVTNAAA